MTIPAKYNLALDIEHELFEQDNLPCGKSSDLVEIIFSSISEISTTQRELSEIEVVVNDIMDNCHPIQPKTTILKETEESSRDLTLESMTSELVCKVEALCKVKNMHSANQTIYLSQIYKIEQYLSGELDLEGTTPSEHLLQIEAELRLLLSKIKTSATQNIEANRDDLKRQIHWAKLRGEEIINNVRQFLSNNLLDISMVELAS